jgi:hypothetical protein
MESEGGSRIDYRFPDELIGVTYATGNAYKELVRIPV